MTPALVPSEQCGAATLPCSSRPLMLRPWLAAVPASDISAACLTLRAFSDEIQLSCQSRLIRSRKIADSGRIGISFENAGSEVVDSEHRHSPLYVQLTCADWCRLCYKMSCLDACWPSPVSLSSLYQSSYLFFTKHHDLPSHLSRTPQRNGPILFRRTLVTACLGDPLCQC